MSSQSLFSYLFILLLQSATPTLQCALIGDYILPLLVDILVECVLVQTTIAPFSQSEKFYCPSTPTV